MRLDPVYVVAPRPAPPSIPTRRALLIAGAGALGAFCAGIATGWTWRGPAAPPTEPGSQPGDSTDETLRWLQDLAAPSSPVDGLVTNFMAFVWMVPRRYPDHPELWDGMVRLAQEVLKNEALSDRAKIARDLADCFAGAVREVKRPDLARLVPALRLVGGR